MEINKIVLTSFNFKYFNNRQEIDDTFNEKMKEIKVKFKEIKEEFYKKNNIDDKDVKININYDCTLQEFYEQLIKIKENYSKEALINKRLTEEIEKYKGYSDYEQLKELIKICKNNALIHIKQNNFQNIEDEIQKMHQSIITEVFETYYSLKKKISDLEATIGTINDEGIKKEYNRIKNNFTSGESFRSTEEALENLEKMIQEYNQQLQKESVFEQNESTINEIYRSLIDRYSNALKQCNSVTEYDNIISLNKFLQKVLELFSKGCQAFAGLDYFKLFNSIGFSNLENDHTIVDNINIMVDSINKLKKTQTSIYITTKKDSCIYGTDSFYVLDEKEMELWRIFPNISRVSQLGRINYDELKEKYIPLKEFLKTSKFVGEYRVLNFRDTIELLYINDEFILYRLEGMFRLTNLKTAYNMDMRESRLPKNEEVDKYRDREYVYSQIERQVLQSIKEFYNEYSRTYQNESYTPDNNTTRRK